MRTEQLNKLTRCNTERADIGLLFITDQKINLLNNIYLFSINQK